MLFRSIVTVDGLEIPFFGFCKRSVRDYKVGDFVKILVVVVLTRICLPYRDFLSVGILLLVLLL